jgi:hypothetical protein
MIHDDRFPKRLDPDRNPGGVVIQIYRWADAHLLRERQLTTIDAAIEALVDLDYDATWSQAAEVPGRRTRAIVLIGYDGDTGAVMSPPMLVTDDPDLLTIIDGPFTSEIVEL